MIALARAISHGINYLNYISGDAEKKMRPWLIHPICSNGLEPYLDRMGVWQSMQLDVAASGRRIKNTVIEFAISPAKEHTKGFSSSDWEQLWEDFVKAFDSLESNVDGHGKIAESKFDVWLHQDSDSSIPHLHAAVCRVDKEGRINDDHHIAWRAQRAAEIVALQRGWSTANDVKTENIELRKTLRERCENILRHMPNWSWDAFKETLDDEGFPVLEKHDNQGNLVRWAIVIGDKKLWSSKIYQRLSPAKIEAYWRELREKELRHAEAKSNAVKSQNSSALVIRPEVIEQCQMWHDGLRYFDFNDDNNRTHQIFIPEHVLTLFENEFDYRYYANGDTAINEAVALFIGYIDAATSIRESHGGGGTNSDKKWGRDPEEDYERASRCAALVKKHFKLQPRNRTFRR